jgi:hypothetical protein
VILPGKCARALTFEISFFSLVAEPPDDANEGGAVQLRVRVEDFSRNGTFVNGQRVGAEPLPVKDGDIISLVVVPEVRADGSFHVLDKTRYMLY